MKHVAAAATKLPAADWTWKGSSKVDLKVEYSTLEQGPL
jgi:hypothetical protein